MTGYDKLIYRFNPIGYGDWGCPYYFAKDYVESFDGYDDKGNKQTHILTNYYVLDHHDKPARLYVPEGMTAQDTGLDIFEVKA